MQNKPITSEKIKEVSQDGRMSCQSAWLTGIELRVSKHWESEAQQHLTASISYGLPLVVLTVL